MTALQVLRFEAALWEIAEEVVYAGEPHPDHTGIDSATEPAGRDAVLTPPCGCRVGCDLQRWLDLNA